jgi:hypothetical protein
MNSDMMGSSFRQERIEPIRRITRRGATHVLGTRDAGTPSFHSVFRARETLKGTYIFIDQSGDSAFDCMGDHVEDRIRESQASGQVGYAVVLVQVP